MCLHDMVFNEAQVSGGRNLPHLITTPKWKIRRVTEMKLGEHQCNL